MAASAACWAGDSFCGGAAGAALALTVNLAITRGLHLDGLADAVDGFAGGWGDRQRTLEIMRDSRIGSLGAAAVVVCLLLRFAAVGAAAAPARWLGVLAAPVAGRMLLVLLLYRFAYLHPEGGAGAVFAGGAGRAAAALAAGTGLGAVLAAGGLKGLVSAAWAALAGYAVAGRIARSLGGLTGDCYGAACESAEVAFLLAWSILW